MNKISLTPDQQVAVDAIREFLIKPGEYIFTLSGVGGAGKTTSIREAIRGLTNVVGATVSHSAKDVLAKSLAGSAICYTLAQMMGMRQSIDEDGNISFQPARTGFGRRTYPIDSADYIIIDECSMIDVDTFNMIVSRKKAKAKLIFLGDVYQLPPIKGEEDSITFQYTQATLNKPVRYTGPIADLGMIFRNAIDKINSGDSTNEFVINEWQTDELGNADRTSLVNEDGSGYIFMNDINKLVDLGVKIYKEGDSEDLRFIAYKNASTKKINAVMRQWIYCDGDAGMYIPQFMPGELVICNGGYNITMYHNGGRETHNVIYNNQTFKVKETMEIEDGPGNLHAIALRLDPEPAMPDGHEIYALDQEKSQYAYWDRCNELKRNAKEMTGQWPVYYAYKEQWADFDYGYAITSHKSLD